MAIALAPQSSGTLDLGSLLQSVPGLVNLFANKSQTSSGSTTTEGISQDGLNAMLQNLLGSTQGLAAVTSGQKGAGLYNSTTNQQLTNDLLTRAAGQVAQNTKTTTTGPSTVTSNAPLGTGTIGALGGGLALLKLANAAGITGKGKNALSDLFGGSGSDATAETFGGPQFTTGIDPTQLNPGSLSPTLTGATGSLAGDVSQSTAGVINNSATINALTNGVSAGNGTFSTIGNLAGTIGDGAGLADAAGSGATSLLGLGGSSAIDVGSAASDAASAAGVGSNAFGFTTDAASGLGDASSILGGAGSFVGSGIKLLQGDIGGAAESAGATALGGAIGSAIFPGVGTAVGSALGSIIGGGNLGGVVNGIGDVLGSVGSGIGDVASGIGDVVGDIGSGIGSVFSKCFITTAMCQYYGLADDCEELETLRHFRDTYMESTPEMQAKIEEYYHVAPGYCEKLEHLGKIDKIAVFARIREYIKLAVENIKAGNNQYAYLVYVQLVDYVKEAVHG